MTDRVRPHEPLSDAQVAEWSAQIERAHPDDTAVILSDERVVLDLRDCRARCAELERELAKIKSDAADAGFVPSMWYARAVAAERAVATLRRSSDAVLAMIENGWIPPDPFPEDPPWTLERSWDEACNAFRISRAAAELRADFAATAAIPAPETEA